MKKISGSFCAEVRSAIMTRKASFGMLHEGGGRMVSRLVAFVGNAQWSLEDDTARSTHHKIKKNSGRTHQIHNLPIWNKPSSRGNPTNVLRPCFPCCPIRQRRLQQNSNLGV